MAADERSEDRGPGGETGTAPGAGPEREAGRSADSAGGRASSEAGPERTAGALPQVDFSTFVLSLGTTALYQMGVMEDPVSGERGEPDLVAAQQTVDTLEMLREKTLGNLDEEERKLLDSLLYELRMRFVEKRR